MVIDWEEEYPWLEQWHDDDAWDVDRGVWDLTREAYVEMLERHQLSDVDANTRHLASLENDDARQDVAFLLSLLKRNGLVEEQ